MKKLVFLVLTVILAKISLSQSISYRSNGVVTVSDMRLQAEKNFFVPRYNDTTEANLNKGIDSCGALIFSRDVNAYYYRACNPKKWTLISGSSGSTDTTSLSNRINQAFTSATKISDTSFFMSSPTGTNDTIILNGAPVYVESPIMAKVSNDSNIIYFNADTANAWRGGSGTIPTLQQVTTAGNITADSIVVQDITLKNPSGATGLSTSIYLGYGSTYNDLSSIGTIAIGHQVMDGSTPSGQSVVIGATAGQYGYPNDCVLIGEQAGGFMSNIGSPNGNLDAVGVGHQSLYGASGVQDGVFLGAYSGKSSTGEQVIGIGHSAGESNSKDTTILIGYSSGKLNSGNRLISIGGNSGVSNTFNDGIILGANTGLTADSQLVVANYVNKLKLPGLAKGVPNYVLTDTSGNGDIVLALGGGSPIDTTSLSNRINSKIDSLERRTDSIFAYKNGQWNFQYKTVSTNTGGGASVNYYLNGSVSQGTFGGDTYYQMSKTPIAGAGTNFTRTNASGNGYIASFITDAGDPNLLNIPGGNWNLEFYFNSSSSGGTPSFYGEIYKVSASNVFTLIASGVTNPEGITNGTVVDQYFTSIPVPQTTLVATDRIAIRIFVTTGGRNITLHTEDNNLSEVLTTFSTGINGINGLTAQLQYFQTGTSGTDFGISSTGDTHTFNLPDASASNRGALTSANWTTFNNKLNATDTTVFQRKLIAANSFMANNTASAANATAATFKQFGNQTYSDSITITGSVNPSGAINHTFRWSQVGNLVTLHITLTYATNGSLSQIGMELPDGLPIPILPTGLTANNDIICYGNGYMVSTTTGLAPVFSKVFLRQNTGLTNDYEIVINQGAASTYRIVNVTIQYFAQ